MASKAELIRGWARPEAVLAAVRELREAARTGGPREEKALAELFRAALPAAGDAVIAALADLALDAGEARAR